VEPNRVVEIVDVVCEHATGMFQVREHATLYAPCSSVEKKLSATALS